MAGDMTMLSSLSPMNGGFFFYGNNNKRRIIDIDNTGNFSNPTIGKVILVVGLKHNHLNISQLCEKGKL